MPDVTDMLANLHPAEAAQLLEHLGDDIALKVIDPAGIPINTPDGDQWVEPYGSVFAVEPKVGEAMIAAGVAERVNIQARPIDGGAA